MDKLVTFAIPCYNSAGYMDRCITSILRGSKQAEDVQVIIVDDGSTDDTGAKADEWAARYPDLIKAVHQENGGHGIAVLSGLANADGVYYKVVDSDDWLDEDALAELLSTMRSMVAAGDTIDLFVCNYVYEHTTDGTHHTVNYHAVLPRGRAFSWNEIGHFRMDQNLLMHSLCYRTEILRDGGVPLPAHTFYVDNIYAWVPLPRCKRLYYLDVDLYRYFIGREDQSVNEKVMAGRIEQQIRVTRIMMHAYHPYQDIKCAELRSYMVDYFVLMMAICSVFSRLSDHPDAMDECEKLWQELHDYDQRLWRRCRFGITGTGTNLPGKGGQKLTIDLYRLVKRIVKFN